MRIESFSKANISNRSHLLLLLLLTICTLWVYIHIGSYDFINIDDDKYVVLNSHVNQGLSLKSIAWAFGFSDTALEFYWHPLTWISHMTDIQLFGRDAGMHHYTSLFIHIVNALLLFIIFYKMTKKTWQSFFVAALFALHPMNVDSVAWIAERKNVLSTLFWFLIMLSYVSYAKKPGLKKYLLILILFISGMMCKPMLLTLPCVLLLLDFWPLGRIRIFKQPTPQHDTASNLPKFSKKTIYQAILEKLPLLLISILFTIISIYSVHSTQQILSGESLPFLLRFENAIVTYLKYIGKIIWPQNFAIFYPFPDSIPIWQVLMAGCALAGMTIFALLRIRKAPYIIVGWLWYMGTMFPVSGIFQQGRWPEMADRWAYVPTIGLFIVIAWGGSHILSRLPYQKILSSTIMLTIIGLLMILSRHQVSYWKNSQTLLTHALQVTKNNYVAMFNMGAFLATKGKTDQAIDYYRQVMEIRQESIFYNNLGNCLVKKGKIEEAIKNFQIALRMNPLSVKALNNLGNAYAEKGQYLTATNYFNKALEQSTTKEDIHVNMGNMYIKMDQFDKAIHHFNSVLTELPDQIEANIGMGVALARLNRIDEAIACYKTVLKVKPENAEAHNNLATLLLQKNQLAEAKTHFQAALKYKPDYDSAQANLKKLQEISENRQNIESRLQQQIDEKPDNPELHYKMGVLYHKTEHYDQAIKSYQAAIDLDPQYTSALFNLGVVLATLDKYEHAVDVFKQLIELQPDNNLVDYNLACIYSKWNKPEEAIHWIKKAEENGYNNWEKLKTDPDLENIRSHEYFQNLLNFE